MSEDTRSLSDRLADDLVTLDAELSEVDLLITQARTEAARHDSRRTAASEKVDALGPDGDVAERLELTTNLVLLTKRAALMESQVDVLEGKRRALGRFRDGVAAYLEAGPGAPGTGGAALVGGGVDGATRPAPTRRPCRGSCSARRRTCAGRSPGRCTTARPRA